MITKSGIFFEISLPSDYWGKNLNTVAIHHTGKVNLISRIGTSGEFSKIYNTIQDFFDDRPIIASEIVQWSRENNKNLDSLFSLKGTDLVPMTKTCTKCHATKELIKFPFNSLSFDAAHNDCCECRVKECRRIKAQCNPAVPKTECHTCPVYIGA